MLAQIVPELQAAPRLSVDQVLSPYIWVFYASFLVAFAFTPVMRSVALNYGIVDQPSARKMHTRPVAYLGGVAVFLGWIVSLAVSQSLALHFWEPGMPGQIAIPVTVVLGAVVIVLLGLFDDIKTGGVTPTMKILGQIAAAFALLMAGIGDQLAEPIVRNINERAILRFGVGLGPEASAVVVKTLSGMLTIAIVVFCCNASNLMDGLDGLCGGVTAIIATGFLALCVYLALYSTADNAIVAGMRVVLSLALLGAVLGFVPFNFNPASIFMGDAGSMFLGFACALAILLVGEVELKWLLAALVMFSLPVLDTALAFARRWVNGRPLFSADKFHFHHQLVSRGLSVRQAVLLAYGLSIFFVLLGLAIVFMRTRYAVALYLVIFGSIVVTAYKMGMVHEKSSTTQKGVDAGNTAAAETEGAIDVRPTKPPTTV